MKATLDIGPWGRGEGGFRRRPFESDMLLKYSLDKSWNSQRRHHDEGRLYFVKLVIHIIGTDAQQRFKGLLGSFTKSEIISNYVGVARRVDTQHLNVYKQDAKVPH